MHGADEFLCRNWVILKCEAVALVGQHKLARTRVPFISNGRAIEECVDECQCFIINNVIPYIPCTRSTFVWTR